MGARRAENRQGLSLREAMRALKRAGIEFVTGYRGGVYHVATRVQLLERQWKQGGAKPEPRPFTGVILDDPEWPGCVRSLSRIRGKKKTEAYLAFRPFPAPAPGTYRVVEDTGRVILNERLAPAGPTPPRAIPS